MWTAFAARVHSPMLVFFLLGFDLDVRLTNVVVVVVVVVVVGQTVGSISSKTLAYSIVLILL